MDDTFEGYIVDCDERQQCISIAPWAGQRSAEPLRVSFETACEQYRPHRWVEHVQELAPPYNLRARYRPRPGREEEDDLVWEAARHTPLPAWAIRRGDQILRRRDGLLLTLTGITRTIQLTLTSEDGTSEVIDGSLLGREYLPFYEVRQGSHWYDWTEPSMTVEVLSTEGRVLFRTGEGDFDATRCISDFLLEFDPVLEEPPYPTWVTPTAPIRHVVTGEDAVIESVDHVHQRPYVVIRHSELLAADLLIEPVSLDTVVREWYPKPVDSDLFSPEHETFWIWPNPLALVQTVRVTPSYVDVRMIPSGRVETIPARTFHDMYRRHELVQLSFRSRTACPNDLKPGGILDIPMHVAVEAIREGQLILLSETNLSGMDGAMFSSARVKNRTPATSLGFALVVEGLPPQAEVSIEDCVFFGENEIVEVSWPDDVSRPEEGEVVNLTLPGQSPHEFVVTDGKREKIRVRRFYRGHRSAKGFSYENVLLRLPEPELRPGMRIFLAIGDGRPSEYDIREVVGATEIRVEPVRSPEIQPMIVRYDTANVSDPMVVVSSEPVLVGSPPDAEGARAMWIHITKCSRCEVLSYDEQKRTARIRWFSPGAPEEEIPVSDLLSDFRSLTRQGADKAQAIANAPGSSVWERLLR